MDQDRDFTREPAGRFEWEQVMRRVVVSKPSVKLVALSLATYADTKSGGQVRPGLGRLVAVTGTSRNVVLRALAELKELGMIDQLTRGGNLGRASKGMASVYRLTLPSDLLEVVTMLTPDGQEQVPTLGPVLAEEVPLPGRVGSEQVPIETGTGPKIVETGPSSGTLPLQRHLFNKTPLQTRPRESADADAQPAEPQPTEAVPAKQLEEDFQTWYRLYPKHQGKAAALNSYKRARKNGATAEDLMSGAERYAAERKGQDLQYTKMPATWLNQGCWEDEYGQELDIEAILGRDVWTPGAPPAGLSIQEEIQWKKDQRILRQSERLSEARARVARTAQDPISRLHAQYNAPIRAYQGLEPGT